VSGEPLDGRGGGAPGEKYKIPVPALALRRGTPSVLDASSRAIYEYVPFIVVAAELRRLLRFDQAWREARSPELREEIALGLVSESWGSIESIIEDVRGAVL
jgi:hypothetical protein